jgi:hypothetical protein
MSYSYEWQGVGILLRFPKGATLFVQGEEGNELDDELNDAETDEDVERIIRQYEDNLPEEYLEQCRKESAE